MGAGSWRCHGFSPWNQGSGLWHPDRFDDRGHEALRSLANLMNAEARNPFSFKPLPPQVAVQGNDLGAIGVTELFRSFPPRGDRVARSLNTTKAMLMANQINMAEMARCSTA